MKNNQKQLRYFLQITLHLQKNKVRDNQDGYAMLITSILAILMFSMLSVYLFSANLYKSVANSVVDSGSTFYAAESGMNERANIVRDKFAGFAQPTGTSPTGGTSVAIQMQNCINNMGSADATAAATLGTGDLGCSVAEFDYRESAWKGVDQNTFKETYDNNPNVKYRAYSFVNQLGGTDPAITKIPAGEPYAGLNMQEYKYRVYSTALKSGVGTMPVSAQTLLQMDFNSRVIPLFQFAAFYEQDLEITSSSNMSLEGPVHSNSNVWLAPGGTLTAGQITAARLKNDDGTWSGGKIYKSLDRVANYSYLSSGRRVVLGSNTPISVSGAWTTANTQMTAANVTASNGLLNQDTPRLEIPEVGFLSRTGNYYTKADLRVTLDPNNTDTTQKFKVESIVNGTNTTFSAAMIRSLQQPVMLVTTAHNSDTGSTEWDNLCVGNAKTGANFTSTNFANTRNTPVLTADTNASNALRDALAKSSTIYTFSQLNNTKINALGGDLVAKIGSTLTVAQQEFTPRQIANRAGNCFLPAPIQVLTGQRDRQENRNMTILQSNIHSLTIWNRDGQYSDNGTAVLSAASKVFARKDDIDTAVSNGVPAANIPNRSYEWMGLGASDTTERGLVWHFSVDPSVTYTAKQSPYGFGFSGGRWLPGALTLATDQIAYVQGDFNNPGGVQPSTIGENVFAGAGNAGAGISRAENLRHKKPASVLADAIGVLSNNCVNGDGTLNCFNIGSSVASTGFATLEATVASTLATYNTTKIATTNADAIHKTAKNTRKAAENANPKVQSTIDAAKAVENTAKAALDTAKAAEKTAKNAWQSAVDALEAAEEAADTAAAAASSILPQASATSINAAFLAGTADNSGLNNYMRMMEHWGGSAGTSIFRYRGSFVSLGEPQKLNGAYRYGCSDASRCYYNIPGRDFGFDTSFNSASGLPPLAPQVVYLKQKVFRRDYNSDRSN
jgi:hypothetical protein